VGWKPDLNDQLASFGALTLPIGLSGLYTLACKRCLGSLLRFRAVFYAEGVAAERPLFFWRCVQYYAGFFLTAAHTEAAGTVLREAVNLAPKQDIPN